VQCNSQLIIALLVSSFYLSFAIPAVVPGFKIPMIPL
jgi:hypothetical protein